MSRRPGERVVDRDASAPFPRRVAALGGGTGMPAVLRGLRDHFATGDPRPLPWIGQSHHQIPTPRPPGGPTAQQPLEIEGQIPLFHPVKTGQPLPEADQPAQAPEIPAGEFHHISQIRIARQERRESRIGQPGELHPWKLLFQQVDGRQGVDDVTQRARLDEKDALAGGKVHRKDPRYLPRERRCASISGRPASMILS